MRYRLLALATCLLANQCAILAAAPVPRITIDAGSSGVPVSPQMFGVFFEDINFGGDGGLSAELVRNGSFEFFDAITGWRKIERTGSVGGIGFRKEEEAPFPNNPHVARITVQKLGDGFGLRNDGYRGMGLKQGARYRFSAMAQLVAGDPQNVRVELIGAGDAVIGSGTIAIAAKDWTRVDCEISATATEAKGALQLLLTAPGTIDLESISLMPVDTWKGRANGLRADLVQLLADMKPGFIRFPGGCIVEGRTLENRYQWKNTIGPVDNRTMIYNRWNVEFADRGKGAHDYYQSFRLGFFEYFELCADLGAEPVPIINCGMACQFNSGELAPLDELELYVQDALDLIEFANGPVTSTWGRVRADLGHPEPFNLKMLGVGNEQWGDQYFERYAIFAKAIRAKYPEIRLITGAGPGPEDARFKHAWQVIPTVPADIVDEHCYAKPEWFLDNSMRYDRQNREGPKIFMGEYAAHVASRKNTWQAALAEAAFITGLERNADVVTMSSYAPLFAHVDAWQWSPNLIWYDNLRAYGTPNYEVQRLFSLNRGGSALPVKVEHAPVAENGQPRLYASSARDADTGELIVKVVNATAQVQTVQLKLDGAGALAATARALLLTSPGLDDENSLDAPHRIAPVEQTIEGISADFQRAFPAHSLTVLRIPAGS